MYATFLFDPSQLSLVTPLPLSAAPNHSHKLTGGPHFPTSSNIDANSPLTLATCFDQLANATRVRLRQNGAQPREVPAQFAQCQSNNGKFKLTAQAWQLHLGLCEIQLRMVKIDGAKSNIINTWIFPTDPRMYPVYAAELIGVAEQVRVAFVDIQTPVANDHSEMLKVQLSGIARKYAALPCDEAAPEWATAASLGHYTYARGVPTSGLAQVAACYLDYLDLYLDTNRQLKSPTRNLETLSGARRELSAYQLHHMHSSPGQKFLGNLFGVDWTERFMLEFLFSQP